MTLTNRYGAVCSPVTNASTNVRIYISSAISIVLAGVWRADSCKNKIVNDAHIIHINTMAFKKNSSQCINIIMQNR